MTILKHSAVSLHYRLKEGKEDGTLIEETFGGNPLSFIYGIGQMIPGFEANLEGKKSGDSYSFLLSPKEAYGEFNKDAIVQVPLDNFKDEEGKIHPEHTKIGSPVRMKNQDGHAFQGTIIETDETTVKVDFNHPMAGKSLHFSGEIVAVRMATKEEMDHGHVHDGSHH